jgi:hypothetical protein
MRTKIDDVASEMLASFCVLFIFALAFVPKKEKRNSKIWALIIVPAIMLSLLLAYVSVTSVWRPYQMQDDVFREENAVGEYPLPRPYEGVFPWAKLSYPFYLEVFHNTTIMVTESTEFAYGQAQFTLFFANAKTLTVNGTYLWLTIRGPTPLHYELDFIFSDPETFFGFLIAFFTILNISGALLGIALAKTIRKANAQDRLESLQGNQPNKEFTEADKTTTYIVQTRRLY